MQPLQKRWPQGVCTASRRAIRQIGHSYLLSRGGSNSTSYPCVSSVKELGGFPAPLPMLELSSLAAALQALAMAAQQPLSPSRAPQLLSLCSKLMAAGQGCCECTATGQKHGLIERISGPSSQARIKIISSSVTDLVLLKITGFVLSPLSFFPYLVLCRKGHCILSAQSEHCSHPLQPFL